MTMYDYTNVAASGDARAWAKQQADSAYNTRLADTGDRAAALNEAKFAWQKVMDTAGLTGKFEDEWTLPALTGFANQFGTWGAPTPGQETMAREGQTYGQQAGYGQMYGQYYAPGTGPAQGQQTQAAQAQAYGQAATAAGLTGYFAPPGTTGQGTQTLAGQNQQFNQGMATQQEARAAQGQGQSQAMSYLNLLSNLRGPADWAKYQQVLGSTPGGMRDLVAAAMGQYVPGGGATTGMQPQAVSLQSLMGDVSGQPYQGQGGGQLNMPNVYQGGQGMYGQQGGGQMQAYGQPQAQPQTVSGYMQNAQNAYANSQQTQGQQAQYGQQMGQAPAAAGAAAPGGQPSLQSWGDMAARADPYRQQMGQAMQGYPQQPGQQYQTAAPGNPGEAPQDWQQQYQRQQQYQQQMVGQQQQAWGSGIGIGQQGATPQQQQQATGNGTNLPAPNQISSQSWKNMAPSQQQMLLGMYENQGWDKGDVQALYNQSLPKYGASQTTGSFKM